LPVIGSTHVNAYSTGFAFNNIFETYSGDSLKFEPEDAIQKFNTREIIATEVHLALVTLGYKYKKNYFTFSINEKFNSYNFISKNAVLLAYEGNTQFEGNNANMDGTRVNSIHYREYAMGWAREVTPEFNFGIRFKILFGKGNIFTKPTDLRLYTHPTTFDLTMEGSADIYSSFPIDVTTDTEGDIDNIEIQDDVDWVDYTMNKQNKGFGIDLGFTYDLDELTTLSGSLLDIGYINWKSNPYHFHSDGTYSADEIENFGAIVDTLTDIFNPTVLQENYQSPLVPAMYFGVSRILNDWMDVGAVAHTELYKNRLHPSLTFSGNATIHKNLSVSGSYTIQNGEWNNLGFGFGAKLGFLHLHAISDNVPGLFNLTNTRNTNLRFGLSLLFGCKKRTRKISTDNGIRALPCFNDPYKVNKKRRKR
jgi:hypothetical protein